MLYAATRNTLTKSLGSTHFTDNIFATSKDDLGAEAYAKHKRHVAAPPPMSAREKELEEGKAAEREAGGRSYEGSRARQNHVGQGVGLKWSDEAQKAIEDMGASEGSHLVVLVSHALHVHPAQQPNVHSLVYRSGDGNALALFCAGD